MPLNPVPEDQIIAALRPFRVDPARFEAAVFERLAPVEAAGEPDPLAGLSPFLRGAAALLPLTLFSGCKATDSAAKGIPASIGVKLLGYLAFPAISLFLLLGATLFSFAKVRGIQRQNRPEPGDDQAMIDALQLWWRRHRWASFLVYGVTLALMWFGATGLLFLFYIVSFGLVVYVLASFARLGLGNRQLVGQSCLMGLVLLGQLTASFPIGDSNIHFIDQRVIAVVFFAGALLILACSGGDLGAVARWKGRWARAGLLTILVVPLSFWFLKPILVPATPAQIKAHVESFHEAPFSTSSWHHWEIVARWAVESQLHPDLSGARKLLAAEIVGDQNPFILGNALSVGLIRANQIPLLKEYPTERRALFDGKATAPILSLEQKAWILRASVLLGNLPPWERDHLEAKLLATLDAIDERFDVLESTLLVTQLLEAIGRPIDPARDRARVHHWLRKFQSLSSGGFQLAGGFKRYPSVPTGSVDTTDAAVELMKIYGVPEGLDLNWVRSFLKPMAITRQSDDQWIAAVALDRLNRLPGVKQPTWGYFLNSERSLFASIILVGLCLYATLTSPRRRISATSEK